MGSHTEILGKILLPYSVKRKQVMEVVFLVYEQNVSVIYIDINAILWYLLVGRVFQLKTRPGCKLDIRYKSLSQRVIAEWNSLPSNVVNAKSTESFKKTSGQALAGPTIQYRHSS